MKPASSSAGITRAGSTPLSSTHIGDRTRAVPGQLGRPVGGDSVDAGGGRTPRRHRSSDRAGQPADDRARRDCSRHRRDHQDRLIVLVQLTLHEHHRLGISHDPPRPVHGDIGSLPDRGISREATGERPGRPATESWWQRQPRIRRAPTVRPKAPRRIVRGRSRAWRGGRAPWSTRSPCAWR